MKRFLPLVVMLGIAFITAVQAEIITDGSLGIQTQLTGPNFQVDADLGQQFGGNLFHSFSQFNLNQNQSVTFSGPNHINNIISRITGGQQSSIDGVLRSSIPDANLFLLNPQGFVFGPNAKLDVDGSFHLSTAHYLRLQNEGWFDTDLSHQSTLTSAPPSAFGFLDSPPATIEIQKSFLGTPTGETFSISSGNLHMKGSALTATAGKINLTTVQSQAELEIKNDEFYLPPSTQRGNMSLEAGATLDVGKAGEGNIFIRSGQFEINQSSIFAQTKSDKQGGIVSIHVDQLYLLNDASIDSRTQGRGHGGSINIQASDIVSLSDSNILTSSFETGTGEQPGDAGDIILTSKQLRLFNSTISTASFDKGQGGDITIKVVDEIQLINEPAGLFEPPSAIQASSKSEATNSGDAGKIYIQADKLRLLGLNQQDQGSLIDNSTAGGGAGGSILIKANAIYLTDQASISADSQGTGNAGSIGIETNELTLENSTISTATDKADGGNIILNAHKKLTVDNGKISATVSGGEGNGGNLAISNPQLFQLHGSQVIANASEGNGGIILIVTEVPIQLIDSQITASSETGVDGEVAVEAPYVDIDTLPVEFLDASVLIEKPCATRNGAELSSFTAVGKGGLPNAPDDLQPYLPPLQVLQTTDKKYFLNQ